MQQDWLVEVTTIAKGRHKRGDAFVHFSKFFVSNSEKEARETAKKMALEKVGWKLFSGDKQFKGWQYRNHKNVHVLNKASMFLRQKGNMAYQIEIHKVEIVDKRPNSVIEYRKMVEFE